MSEPLPPPWAPTIHAVPRLAVDSEVPARARTLATLANKHGWVAVPVYSRGLLVGAVSARREVEAVSLRLFRVGSDRLVGMWFDGKFAWGASSRLESLNLTALRARVTEPVSDGAS